MTLECARATQQAGYFSHWVTNPYTCGKPSGIDTEIQSTTDTTYTGAVCYHWVSELKWSTCWVMLALRCSLCALLHMQYTLASLGDATLPRQMYSSGPRERCIVCRVVWGRGS